jgi:lipopolysaccharide biosynthesis regulator YciM
MLLLAKNLVFPIRSNSLEFFSLSNLQIFIIISVVLVLIIFFAVNSRSKNIPTDTEAFNNALKALISGKKDKAYYLLREIISKDSNNIDAYLLLGDIVRDKDVKQAIKIHQTVVLRPQISKLKKIEAHIALSKDFLKDKNIIKAEEELNNILSLDSANKWALLKLKDIASQNQNWKEALKHEKKLMSIDINHKKNDESMLNYYIAMDYKSKDKIKNYVRFLEKSADASNIYPETALELANHNKDNIDVAISYYKLYAQHKPSQRTMAYNKIENILFDNQQYDEVENLYISLLDNDFDGFALNRLVDILLEKNEVTDANELVDRFMKSNYSCHSIRLNKLKLDSDNFELRKSISSLCNEMIKDEIIK